jgi:putative nucleotidyltransferase with HDIG domain
MQTAALRDEVLARAETGKVLPTLNSVITELFRIMHDRNSSFSQVFNIVKYDQAISSKIISIANSAYYARGCKILNLERAMIVIGLEEVQNIIVCLAFLKEMLQRWKLSQHDLADLWRHSLGVACAARALSAKTLAEDPETAFTVSILHDIGKIIFYTYGEEYQKLVLLARRTGRDLCALEKEAFGIDHQEVGYFIAVKWRFPEEFCAVVGGHHGMPQGEDRLLDIVRVADAFMDNPAADLGAEGIILQGEKERILGETKRVSELLGVTDGRE